MRNAVRKNLISFPFRSVSCRAVWFRAVSFFAKSRKGSICSSRADMEATWSRARVSERGDSLSGCARSFDGENANDRSRTEASRMVYERSTSEVVREWHLPVFSMQASSFLKTKRHETKPNETKRNETERNACMNETKRYCCQKQLTY